MKNQRYKNVIVCVVDALRADNLGCYGYPAGTSPNIDRLAKQAHRFDRVVASSANTDPAFTSIITGLFPPSHGILFHANRIPEHQKEKIDRIIFLQEILKDVGYRTHGLDFLGRWHRRGFDYYSGFEAAPEKSNRLILTYVDKVRDRLRIQPGTRLQSVLEKTPIYDWLLGLSFKDNGDTPYTPADKQVDDCIALLKDAGSEPNYMFIHFWDTHQPYLFRKDFRKEIQTDCYRNLYPHLEKDFNRLMSMSCTPLQRFFLKQTLGKLERMEDVICSYDSEIRFIDHHIGRLIHWLSDTGQLTDTLLIITADHGENLTEKEIYFSHELITPGVLNIPLIVHAPKENRVPHTSSVVQPVDIMPTLLDLLDIDTTVKRDGLSVYSEAITQRSHAYTFNYSLKRSEWALSAPEFRYYGGIHRHKDACIYCKTPHKPFEELYDRNRDPHEQDNLCDVHPQFTQGFRQDLKQLMKQAEGWEPELDWHVTAPMTEAENRLIEQRLRALGYF